MNEEIPPVSQALTTNVIGLSLEQMIYLWVESKKKRTGSDGTEKMYNYAMQSFRDTLGVGGLDLDCDPVAVALVAQSWASTPQQESYAGKQVSQSTFNQRLAIISSFYRFARKRRFLLIENPIMMLDRAKIEEYAHAEAMDIEELKEALNTIDRTTLTGKRDYALLSTTVHTGRRAAEIAAMQWKDLKIKHTKSKAYVIVHFPHLKGGKTRTDELEAETSSALLAYLYEFY
jgi:site-specific recombinase XerD